MRRLECGPRPDSCMRDLAKYSRSNCRLRCHSVCGDERLKSVKYNTSSYCLSNDIVCNIITEERWKWVVMDNKVCNEILAS
jgi:hypothetical protein